MGTAKSIFDKPGLVKFQNPQSATVGKVFKQDKIIERFSVATTGEARGHNLWVDGEFINSIADFGNAKPSGIKSRFTHPGLSADGMGTQLGRAKNFRTEGNQVFADLFLYKKSNQEYVQKVLDLAEEDPEAFGASVSFERDYEAEEKFIEDNRHKNKFQSPDSDNVKNYPHARIGTLWAVDFVDETAANPGGLFGVTPGNEIPAQAELLLAYAFGITDEEPEQLSGLPHPDRIKAFLQGFLDRHDLRITMGEPERSHEQDENEFEPLLRRQLQPIERRLTRLEKLTL